MEKEENQKQVKTSLKCLLYYQFVVFLLRIFYPAYQRHKAVVANSQSERHIQTDIEQNIKKYTPVLLDLAEPNADSYIHSSHKG